MGWIGLITIIGIIQISYIYAPVSGLIWIILSIPASVWIVVKILRNFSFEFINIFKTPALVFPIIFTWIIFLYFSTLDSNYYDLGLYYEQFFLWISEYKVTPGIGNLHVQFGYSPLVHIITTSMTFDIYNNSGTNVLILSFITLILLNYMAFLLLFRKQTKETLKIQNLIYSSLIVMVITYSGKNAQILLTSSSPDSFLLIIHVSIIFLIFNYFLLQDKVMLIISFNLALLSFLTRQISIVSVLAILFITFLVFKKSKGTLLMLSIYSFFLIFPNLIIKYIISGYFFFPLPLTFTNPNFMVPQIYVQGTGNVISGSAFSVFNYYWGKLFPELNYPSFLLLLLLFLIFMSIVFFLSLHLQKRGAGLLDPTNWPKLGLLLWSVVTLMIWALAPDPRFISYLLFSALIFIFYLLFSYLSSIILLRMRKPFYLVTLNMVVLILLLVNTNLRPSESKIIPLSEFKFNSFPLSTSTLVFYPADEKFDRCWNLSFPCIPRFDPELRLMTNSITGGFKRKN
jgi:hypothetical protein